MARPVKAKRICSVPVQEHFGPLDIPAETRVRMTLEEYETIRLIDHLDCTQEECASQMGVARTTVQAVYNSARKKLADVLVNARQLEIGGGNYKICPESGGCCGKDCQRRRSFRRGCDKKEHHTGGCIHEDCGNIS